MVYDQGIKGVFMRSNNIYIRSMRYIHIYIYIYIYNKLGEVGKIIIQMEKPYMIPYIYIVKIEMAYK
jgi:hypothetical protein